MEEYVGELWDRFITGVADKHHVASAVKLDDVAKSVSIFFRALGGDSGLAISAAPAVRHGARRRLLQRVAGSGERVELAWRDGEVLRLPSQINLYADQNLNRDLYFWLAAFSATAVDEHKPWIVRNQLATIKILTDYPGLKSRYERLVSATLANRIPPEKLPKNEALQEMAIRQALLTPGAVNEFMFAEREFQPVPLWTHPCPPINTEASKVSNAGDPKRSSKKLTKSNRRRHLAERKKVQEEKNGLLMMFRAESIFSWSEFINVNRPQDDDDSENAARQVAEDLDKLTLVRENANSAAGVKFDLDLPSSAEDDLPLGEGVLLPEWNWKKQRLQPDYCSLQALLARDAIPCELPPTLGKTVKHLRQQLQSIVPTKRWLRAQQDGEELDLDAWIAFSIDKRRGHLVSERGLYRKQVKHERDLACLLLADLSLSTEAYVSNEARVIDVVRDSLFLFSEALSATGDRFALYGFSSLRKSQIRFHHIKGFDEKYGDDIRGRIQAIKPGYYTRMGAAIRHASNILKEQKSQQRLMLILTDGKPNDLDQYEGRYGVEDTKVAVIEAKKQGLRPFCVTIDTDAGDYLPHLFGIDGYVVIRNPKDLPSALPKLYAQMTQ